MSKNKFIERAVGIYADRYDYSNIIYKNYKTNLTIKCNIHNIEFCVTPQQHIYRTSGCYKCKNEKKTKYNDIWIEKAKKKHGEKYDYSKVNYINSYTKIKIICIIHGEFEQTPYSHLKCINPCPKCQLRSKNSQIEWIEKAKKIHDNKYDYSKVNYINSKTNVTIICPKHGEFIINPSDHLRKICRKCAYNIPTTSEWIMSAKKIHGEKYDYSKVNYVNTYTKIKIICVIHGEFEILPYNHTKYKIGCNKCNIKQQKSIPCINNNIYANRYSTASFIDACIHIHGEKYDYSKVNYINSHKKIKIICYKHGEFEQKACAHLQGKGCIKCVNKYNYTLDEWIDKAKKVHDNKYDYSKVNYTKSSNKVIIICPIHKEFIQIATQHIRGKGCPKCSGHYIPTTDEWIKKAVEIHGNKYNYSKTKYTKSNEKIIIICSEHGDFLQTPSEHIRGSGCIKCSNKYSYTTTEFIEKAKKIHDNKYNYSKVRYTVSINKIIITCPEHGDFLQTPKSHLAGYGCIKCANTYVPTTKEWIEKAINIHGDKYDYSKTNYVTNRKKVIIICYKHGEFKQLPYNHIYGSGCNKCLYCPKCLLWKTNGKLCSYCMPINKNSLCRKTKEMEIVEYLKKEIPEHDFIHNKSVGNSCTNGHLFPDIRFDCLFYYLIVEIDEFKHRGANYKCDEQRMYDIIAKLGMPCIFIRYNPDNKESDKKILLNKINYYLDLKKEQQWDDYGFKVEYLFY